VPDTAALIRPGEHACCRFALAADRERLAMDFVSGGLRRGHRVLYMAQPEEIGHLTSRVAAEDPDVATALRRGQLELRRTEEAYLPDGCFDPDRMVDAVRDAHSAALAYGYSGLSITGDVSWALSGAPGCDRLPEYERRAAGLAADGSLRMLCRYEHARFDLGLLAEIAAVHDLDASPELASIGRHTGLAGARTVAIPALRLVGELAFDGAEALAALLSAHFHGRRRLDLADLHLVDVAGMRALRGHGRQSLQIRGASDAVRRLLALLAWDTDPAIEVVTAS
jgi:ABC-type transporter Mla MlaB component